MKTININVFDLKSIENAIKTLNQVQIEIDSQMIGELLQLSCELFIEKANVYLSNSSVGENVKNDIKSNWQYVTTPTKATIQNYSEKAVYVEFGVGIVGQGQPHKNASETGYEYNVPSDAKTPDGAWGFEIDDKINLDLPQGSYKISKTQNKNGLFWIYTKGTKGCFYAFNALEDLKLELPRMWEEIKIKHWGR